MFIDRDSQLEVLIVWIAALILIAALRLVDSKWISTILSTLVIVLTLFITYFFRVPTRECPGDDDIVTAVADGKIVIVEKAYEPEFLKKECMQVSIYMDFFDVHANFWPVDGEVNYYKYHPGKHLLAFLPKSSLDNEHSSSCIITEDGNEVFFKQIAGGFARRIVCYSEPGLKTEAGQQCGIIKFGSRIDLYLPLDAEIMVEIGDKVRACETVIAKLQ